MTLLVTYLPGPEGDAALEAASQSLSSDEKLLVVLAAPGSADLTDVHQSIDAVRDLLDEREVRYEVSPVPAGRSVGDYVVERCAVDDIRLVIFGIRQRTRSAALELGAHARRVILEVSCPVLVVKSTTSRAGADPR